MDTFQTKVQQYDDTQDLFIEIPHYILQNLNWEEGDELAWSIKGNQIILTKINNTTQSKEKSRETNNDQGDWYTVKKEEINHYLNSESEGKEYKDQQYEAFLYETSPEAQGYFHQGDEFKED